MTEPTTEAKPGGTLAWALVNAQAELPTVKKDGQNPHFNSRFMTLDALIAATLPIMNKHGLAVQQQPVANDNGLPMLRTTITYGPTGEQLSGDTPLFLARNDMQAFGAAITYARRYAWAALLGIAAEEDTDGEPPAQAAAAKPDAKRGPRAASEAQRKKMFAMARELNEGETPVPADYTDAGDWMEVLRARMRDEYGADATGELASKQASELIEWLDAQKVPF